MDVLSAFFSIATALTIGLADLVFPGLKDAVIAVFG